MSISGSAVLAELNISVWTANKLDKQATVDINNSNGAVKNAAQVRKNLMSGTYLRKEIADYAAGCRLWHNIQTLPWADRGSRLLPTSLFMEYKQAVNVRRDYFNSKVNEFINAYPSLVRAAGNNMGTLFDVDDYPSADEVRDKFKFNLVFSPVPEAGDFRLDIPQQELEEVQSGYESQFNDRVAEAMKRPWQQLHTLIEGMSEKLDDDKGDPEKKRYHETLVTNANELCDMLVHLNITNDPKLEEARKALKQTMRGIDIESLKGSDFTRRDVKANLDSILKTFEW